MLWVKTELPHVLVNTEGQFIMESKVVKSVSSKGNEYSRTVAQKSLVPRDNGLGYLQISSAVEGLVTRRYAHRLVWEAFNGTLLDGLEIDHKNNDKSDNRLVNLQAVTRKFNMDKCHRDNPHILEAFLGSGRSSTKGQ